jgi:hypothetical protein
MTEAPIRSPSSVQRRAGNEGPERGMTVRQRRLRGLLLALVSSFALALVWTGAAGAAGPSGSTLKVERLVKAIRKHRSTAWHWKRVTGRRRTTARFLERRVTDPERLAALRDLWKRRASLQRKRASNPPHEAAWRCIHRHEGAWNDPNAPYYGGLQMNKQFQRSYGRYLFRLKGTADKWSPAEQMWTAERAYRSGTGFRPWPNTARYCGLL